LALEEETEELRFWKKLLEKRGRRKDERLKRSFQIGEILSLYFFSQISDQNRITTFSQTPQSPESATQTSESRLAQFHRGNHNQDYGVQDDFPQLPTRTLRL
jgi:hypothetical protein